MANVRLIPRLDIKGPNVVKGIHLEGLRVLGKPEDYARYYYEGGADELFYMDAVASLYGRNSLVDIIKTTAQEIFIPLTVGGGLRSVEDIRTVLRSGADKVALNTAAVHHPQLVRDASRRFGSSTIVVSIEAIKKTDGTYEAYTDYGREKSGVDAMKWARTAEELGAGEIMVTSIDREGTGTGFDLELTRTIAESVSIPVIACGGAGTAEHIRDVIFEGKADAVSLASILHYGHVKKMSYSANSYPREGNTEFLRRGMGFLNFEDTTLTSIKGYLVRQGVDCRYPADEVANA